MLTRWIRAQIPPSSPNNPFRLYGAVGGFFAASSKSCVAGSCLYLHEDIADEFLQRMSNIAASVNFGDPMLEETEIGPLCTKVQLELLKNR